MSEIQIPPPPEILEALLVARQEWSRREWCINARTMGSVALGGTGIDDALDDYNAYQQSLSDFEGVFGGE